MIPSGDIDLYFNCLYGDTLFRGGLHYLHDTFWGHWPIF